MNDYIITKWYVLMKGHIEDEEAISLDNVSQPLIIELKKSLKYFPPISEDNGLAKYVDEDYKEEIENILFDSVGKSPSRNNDGSQSICTCFRVDLNRRKLKHTDRELERYIKNFLLAQASDGWGEHFSQFTFDGKHIFHPWTEKETYCVIDE